MTGTRLSPGLTVITESTLATVVLIFTVTLCPAASVPEVRDRRTVPIRLDGSEIDQVTGPPVAVIVIELLPSRGVSSSAVGVTLTVPVAASSDGGVDGAELAAGGDVGVAGGVAGPAVADVAGG
jgi:hypothetical protein